MPKEHTFVIETLVRVVVPNILDGIADNLLVVQRRLGGDFAKDHHLEGHQTLF